MLSDPRGGGGARRRPRVRAGGLGARPRGDRPGRARERRAGAGDRGEPGRAGEARCARASAVDAKPAGELGGAVFRQVEPGGGYTVRGRPAARRRDFRVLSGRSAAAERVDLRPGAPRRRLRLPDHPRRHQAGDQRPPARARRRTGPTRPWSSTPATATPTRPGPRAGSSRSPTLLGFAVVDVNMRGTGCSGGAFDYFERLQALDGYDVIETVARQPWALNDKVGMLGHLLRRDQPAVRRRDPAAEPGRDHAAVGDRQHPDDPLPGRDPEHRLRPRVGAGPRRRLAARRRRPPASPGRGSGSRPATRSARRTRTCTRRRST